MKLINKSEYNLMHGDIVFNIGDEIEVVNKIAKTFLAYTGVIEIKEEKTKEKEQK